MISTTIFPGRYVQGYDAVRQRLGPEMSRFGKRGFLLCSPFVQRNILPALRDRLEEFVEIRPVEFRGECSDEEIKRLADLTRKQGADHIVGMGGGKTNDTAKAVAHELGMPAIVIPTIAATDAPCSALSVIYTPKGKFKRYLMLSRNPDLVLADTRIIAEAPVRFLVSGMGDALATWFEAESCKQKHAGNMTGDVGSMAAYSLARLCYTTLHEYGVTARASCEANAVTPALEHIVEANILLSGLGFESGGLASSHAIHNGLTVLEKTHDSYHGEKVAFGTLACLFLTDKPRSTIEEVYDFCESVGLPTSFDDIGLSDVTDEELMLVAEASCAKGETIHNEPVTVTQEAVGSALKIADAMGRSRKS